MTALKAIARAAVSVSPSRSAGSITRSVMPPKT